MYNPISPNVLRQSLRWMAAPKPVAISNPGPTITAKSQTVMAQMNLCFYRQELLGWAMMNCDNELLSNDAIIHCALQNCFCDDIAVQPLVYHKGDTLQMVTVLCSIEARG